MINFKSCGIAVAAVALIGSSALAADNNTAQPDAQQQAAMNDFGKLSHDGARAFQDIRMARLAIFDGNTAKAKSYVDDAQTRMQKARSDDTVFTKAEADLKPQTGTQQKSGQTSQTQANTAPIAWLPVDGSMTLDEDYIANPQKSQSIDKANEQLKNGSHAEAMKTLKLADIDVDFVVEVAPLNATLSGVDQAAQLIGEGHYFQANQALKKVEDATRFDTETVDAAPNGKMMQHHAAAAPRAGKPANSAG